MAPGVTASALGPAPARGLVSTATLLSQLFGTLAFALSLAWIISMRVTDGTVIGTLVVGAIVVFAGGNAHRGSLVGLVLCAAFDAAVAVLCLTKNATAGAFVGVPLARLSPSLFKHGELVLVVAGAVAAAAAIACMAALPQARRFAAWRGEQIMHAARVARG